MNEIQTLLIIYTLFNIFVGLPVCFSYNIAHERLILMGHRFKNIEWHGKIVIILLNIVFALSVIFISILYVIANVFIEED